MKEERFIKIVYEDTNKFYKDVIIPIVNYCEDESYLENFERAVEDIFEQGGFWSNSTTIIPYHRIVSFNTCDKKPQDLSNKNQRPRRMDRRMMPQRGLPTRRIATTTTTTITPEKPLLEGQNKDIH